MGRLVRLTPFINPPVISEIAFPARHTIEQCRNLLDRLARNDSCADYSPLGSRSPS